MSSVQQNEWCVRVWVIDWLRRRLCWFGCVGLSLMLVQPADAQYLQYDALVMICPATAGEQPPSSFDQPGCQSMRLAEVDPHGREIWLRSIIQVPPSQLTGEMPLGFYVSGKMASRLFINGVYVGSNGMPGKNRDTEIPGMMDVVFYTPAALFNAGANEVVLHLSAHHGFLHLVHPVHGLGLEDYVEPAAAILQHYWWSLLPLGALLLGALYLGVLAFSEKRPLSSYALPAMALFASAQLFAEVARGSFPYPYPWHDVRLLVILGCSLGFGLLLLWHVIVQFEKQQRGLLGLVGMSLTLGVVNFVPGFDGKSIAAVMTPTILAALIAGFYALQRRPASLRTALLISVFIIAVQIAPGQFLDVTFFYLVATLIISLMVQQAMAFATERQLRATAQARADRLQQVLDRQREAQQPSEITLQGSGKLKRVSTDQLVYCKGARDYVELVLTDGSQLLHNATLNEMENTLPTTFLRVHRSYLVNTAHILSLRRESSGVGELDLGDDVHVPVSRRIMPKVRQALASSRE